LKVWVAYAGLGLCVTVVVAGILTVVMAAPLERAVWVAAGLAYGLQLLAFAGLLWARRDASSFLVGWLGGIALRFAAVGALAFWVTRTHVLPPAALLVSFVGFLFLLLLLEPLFLNRGARR